MTATGLALAALIVSAALAQPRSVTIGSFEIAWTWNLGLGNEFPGAQGQYELDKHDPHSGAACARLTGDFSGGGAYVAIIRNIDPPIMMERVTFWARSTDTGVVVVRLVDATGQMHQGNVSFATDGKWHELGVGVPQGWAHWSGANDGVFHQPLTGIWLDLDRGQTKTGKGGTIWFDDVAVMTGGPLAEQQFDLRAGRATLGDLDIVAQPVNPEWGAWLMRVVVSNRGKKAAEVAAEADPQYVAPWAVPTERTGRATVAGGQAAELAIRLPAPTCQHLANEVRVTVGAGEGQATVVAAMAGRQAPASPPGTPRPAIELPRNPLG